MEEERPLPSAAQVDRTELRNILTTRFSIEELRNLCQDLGIDYEDLTGEGKLGKARELVEYCVRRGRIEDLWTKISQAKPESPALGECPFKGLEHFTENDALLFFGREKLTAELVNRLRENRFLAVVGASGSGKSSVVQAGLVPALRRGEPLDYGILPPEGSASWPIHLVIPTSHPIEALASSLTRESESVKATATLMDDLSTDARSLHLYIRKILSNSPHPNSRLLLLVDQFEELFTACKDDHERRAFIDNLLTAIALETDGSTVVVIALRADFYHHCAQYDALFKAMEGHQAHVGPMNRDELRRAIEEPAKRNRWDFESGLVDLILRDVGDEPGALPLLSYALLETWERRQGRRLTLEGYAESGGVRGAIAQTADHVYSGLTPEQQTIARNIFVRLTELGEGTQDTRRRVTLDELVPRPEILSNVQMVLKLLSDKRLITMGQGEGNTVEVAHEALIREWPTLRSWLDENRQWIRVQRELTQAAQQWIESGRDTDLLYRGARLVQAIERSMDHENDFSGREREFLNASQEYARQEEAKRTAQQQRELEAARKLAEVTEARRRAEAERTRIAYLVGMVAVVIAIVAIVFRNQAVWQRDEANRQRQIASIRQLEAQAQMLVSSENNSWSVAGLLAVEALDRGAQSVDLSHLVRQLLEHLNQPLIRFDAGESVRGVSVSPDGHGVATVGAKEVKLWDLTSGKLIGELSRPAEIELAHFSPDGKLIATVDKDEPMVRLWDATTLEPVSELLHPSTLVSFEFRRHGAWLVSQSADRLSRVWDVETGKDITAQLFHGKNVNQVIISDDGQRVATVGDGIGVLEAVSGREIFHIDAIRCMDNVILSPDGRWLALYDCDANNIRVWDTSAGKEVAQLKQYYWTGQMSFSPNGRWLAAGSGEIYARVWETGSWNLVAQLENKGCVRKLSFSPGGQSLATIDCTQAVHLWAVPTGKEIAQVGYMYALVFSPDGQWIVTDAGNRIQVWDTATGQEVARLEDAGLPIDFSPDSQFAVTLASGGKAQWRSDPQFQAVLDSNVAQLWKISAGKAITRIDTDTYEGGADISPDGKWVAVEDSLRVRVSEASTGRTVDWIGRARPGSRPIIFSPDGNYLAAGDFEIEIW